MPPEHVMSSTGRYRATTEEDYAAFINVEWRHFVHKTQTGEFVATIAAYTNKRVDEGAPQCVYGCVVALENSLLHGLL